ncbi:hypothetical protein [Robertmurraya andreesenii]|uniref:Uncharacterized protein n=1 Tax=Anoxybacillus andreesenii TaxID=1325932 RepID=A0ABT9V1X7_9BACL|nr:hypothetical protein [Robertmurraya andreesenii]MDQ0154934.1 hypothetical protein [Robertmurraya andreesenii]
MTTIDHALMKSLEYNGEYGARYTCKNCVHCPVGEGYQPCDKQGVDVLPSNNVCRAYEARIKNPSAPEFNFDDYLEFLGSDFYRPFRSTGKIIGEGYGMIGLEITKEGGWRSKYGKYNIYEFEDCAHCRVNMPRCHVEIDGHKFEIDYRRYRECRTVEDGAIHFVLHLWKDKPTQRRYNKEINGKYEVGGR